MDKYTEYEKYISENTNLPKNDVKKIARECWDKGLSKEAALSEARKLYQ